MTVNSQITDAVTQSNVKVVAEAPAMAMGSIYQTMAHSTGILFENALGRAGADTSPGTSYVLAIDPEALDAAGIAVTGA